MLNCVHAVFLLWVSVVWCLKFQELTIENVTWSDPRLLIFKTANYSDPRTVRNLGYLLYSANSRSQLIRLRYLALGGCHMDKPMFTDILFHVSRLLGVNQISLHTARKFFDLKSIVAVKGIKKYMAVEGVKNFLARVVPLSGGPELWRFVKPDFMGALLTNAVGDSDATVTFVRTKNPSVYTFDLKRYMPNTQSFFFQLDHLSITQYDKNISENVVANIFAIPKGYEEILKSFVYMVHFVTCTTAARIVNGKPANLAIGMESGYRPKIESILHDALRNRGGQWPEKEMIFQRIAPFLSSAIELDMLCRCLVNERVGHEEFNDSFRTRHQRMAEAVYSYTVLDNISLDTTARIRLNLELIVLSLVERDYSTRPKELKVEIIKEMIRDIFRSPYDISAKDLIMALIVISDYAMYYEDAKEILVMMMERIDESSRLSMAVLDSSDLKKDLKFKLSYKWRRLYFIHELEMMPKMILIPASFLRPDPPNYRYRYGPWAISTYQRFENYLMSFKAAFDLNYEMDDVEFTRDFLKSFIPWFLSSRYISTRKVVDNATVACFLRPKLGLGTEKLLRVLALALGTAMMIDTRFPEKIYLADPLVEELKKIWSSTGANFLTVKELGELLASGQRTVV